MAGGGWLVRRDPDELVTVADQALAWELSPAEFAELNARWYLAPVRSTAHYLCLPFAAEAEVVDAPGYGGFPHGRGARPDVNGTRFERMEGQQS